MKAYALIMETMLRKRSIFIIHVSWLLTYAALFLIPFPDKMGWNWGIFLFGWSGCLLPLLLSSGIFGDDIASGRISLLVTKPIKPVELYSYRLVGLSLQVTIHLVAASAVILSLHYLTGRGEVNRFATWLIVAWVVFHAWAALSTSLSVVLPRANNSMLLFVLGALSFYLVAMLSVLLPHELYTKVFTGTVRYAGPPVEFLSKVGTGQFDALHSLGSVAHSLVLTATYCALGILILSRREFKRAGD